MSVSTITVNFDLVPGVTSYRIKYRVTGTAGWNLFGSDFTASPATFTVDGANLSYDVSIESNCGNGNYSTPIIKTVVQPAAPTISVTVQQKCSIQPSPNPSAEFYYSINGGAAVLWITTTTSTTYDNLGIIPGVKAGDSVMVWAKDTNGVPVQYGIGNNAAYTGYCNGYTFTAVDGMIIYMNLNAQNVGTGTPQPVSLVTC